jgi:hypothetical protein
MEWKQHIINKCLKLVGFTHRTSMTYIVGPHWSKAWFKLETTITDDRRMFCPLIDVQNVHAEPADYYMNLLLFIIPFMQDLANELLDQMISLCQVSS